MWISEILPTDNIDWLKSDSQFAWNYTKYKNAKFVKELLCVMQETHLYKT